MQTLHFKFRRSRLALVTVVIVTICGCQSTSTAPVLSDIPAKRLEQQGDPYAQMQQLTQRAARSRPVTATALYSQALEIAIELEDIEYLEYILQNLHPGFIDPQTASEIQLMRIQSALNIDNPEELRKALSQIQIHTQDQQDKFLKLSAHLYALERQYANAANTLMQITPNQKTLQALNEEIWRNCSLSSPREIKQQLRSNKSGYARAWWALADSMSGSFSLVEEQQALENWLRDNAAHPGAQFLPTDLYQLAQVALTSRTIALFLPLSGRLGRAGKAIREGFIAAYYHSGYPHRILVYDTYQQDMNSLYEEAVTSRADIIVGPLEKRNLLALTHYPGRTIPVLGLNTLSDDAPEELPWQENAAMLQFSLAVENEAKSVAHRVNQEGFTNIALVSSADSWSRRAAQEFKLGLAASQRVVIDLLLNDIKSTTKKLGNALSVSDSIKRNVDLQRVIKSTTEMTPRSRKDIDVIIALVDGLKASALNSALEYHFTQDIPVFAVSQVTQQLPQSQLAQLKKIEFTEIPWRMNDDLIRKNMADNFGAASRSVDPLNAFGVDAFRLLDKLELMLSSSTQTLHGGTGKLSINAQYKVERELYWAKIKSGKIAHAR